MKRECVKRGEKEQRCLDYVRSQMFFKNGIKIKNPFTGKAYDAISEEEFIKEQDWYLNADCYKNYFGLLEEDIKEIELILRNAEPNRNLNEFPDFVFQSGFIEHFQITSSKTTKKGAKHTKEMSNFASKVNTEAEQIKDKWNESPSFDEVRSKHWTIDSPEHSYNYLVKSFEMNWNNHLESLAKYQRNKNIGIFMVEYPEIALAMYENVYADWIDGMANGNMCQPENFQNYRLSRDKNMLDFVYQHKDKIKYVIFVYDGGFEIIRVGNIPYIIKLLPWEYLICSLTVKIVSSLYNISSSAGKEEDKN